MIMLIFVLTMLLSCFKAESVCNVTKFEEWKNLQYTGKLAKDSSFWIYQTQSFFELQNGLAIKIAVATCKQYFDNLYVFKAGRMGPIDIQTSYKEMCTTVCLESDNLHEQAMNYTSCSCLELSTQETDDTFTQTGDFCLENTARLLCNIVGFCGVWDCRIDDFMCPRYEFNKKLIPYKGFGNCHRSSGSKQYFVNISIIVFAITLLAVIFQ